MHSTFMCIAALCLTGIILPVLVGADATNSASTGRVSNEDIRDAVLSLVYMLRDNMDKLERHESRERQLGEQLKKSLFSLEKKPKIEESSQLVDTLTTINRRLESIEAALAKERSPSLSDSQFQQSIQKRMGDMEESMRKNELGIEDIRSNSMQKLEAILSNVLFSQTAISSLDQRVTQSRTGGNADLTNMETKLTNIESFQGKLETISTLQRSAMEELTRVRQSIGEYTNGNCQVPHSLIPKLEELLHEIGQNGTGRCHDQTEKTHSLINENHRAMLSVISEKTALSMGENRSSEIDTDRYEELLKELKDLSKIKQVLVQTADNVLDTKRRIEYGTHQILLEMGEMIKSSSKETNETVNRRFDTISTEILGNTSGALQNLSSKLEMEISQVWRQIGNMYQTLTNSADSLDKLHKQTEIYVNSSSSIMDSMKGKVGLITNRMSEVDENLNYLLGRLSLVTQEFNQIKMGLGEALDNIRKSFHSVQDKVKDSGPGPNPIDDESASAVAPILLKSVGDGSGS